MLNAMSKPGLSENNAAVKLLTLAVFSQFRALKRNLSARIAHVSVQTQKNLYFDLLLFSIGEEKRNLMLF